MKMNKITMILIFNILYYTPLQDTHQDVQGLFENQKYLFRVMAVNEHGQSEPLQAENPIVAKMPFGELKKIKI